jgi:integrator complex subunit 11
LLLSYRYLEPRQVVNAVRVVDAGAGQDVGKSCVVATIGGRRVMFDCGVHLSYRGRRSYPEFDRVLAASGATDFTAAISCVVITHSSV